MADGLQVCDMSRFTVAASKRGAEDKENENFFKSEAEDVRNENNAV